MRNCDYYNNPTDLNKAFEEYCDECERQGIDCADCQFYNNPTVSCRANFTYAEYVAHLLDKLLLKPCPCCHGTAVLRKVADSNRHWVECEQCRIQTAFGARNEVIEKWNRRTEK